MAEYIEREALKRAIRKAFHDLGVRIDINSVINAQPTADVVEVVRCKDCVYYENFLCGRFSAYGNSVEEPEYDYCSFGERRK